MVFRWLIGLIIVISSIIFMWNGFGLFNEEPKQNQVKTPLCVVRETNVSEENWTLVQIVNAYCKGHVFDALDILLDKYEAGNLYVGQRIVLP